MKKITWVLVANKSGAALFDYQSSKKVKLIKMFDHPLGSCREQDLNSDRPGKLRGQTIVREDDSKEHEDENFANHLSHYLNNSRNENQFNEFVLIAGPGFGGVIKSKFNKDLRKLLTKNVSKEISLKDEKKICDLLAS